MGAVLARLLSLVRDGRRMMVGFPGSDCSQGYFSTTQRKDLNRPHCNLICLQHAVTKHPKRHTTPRLSLTLLLSRLSLHARRLFESQHRGVLIAHWQGPRGHQHETPTAVVIHQSLRLRCAGQAALCELRAQGCATAPSVSAPFLPASSQAATADDARGPPCWTRPFLTTHDPITAICSTI